MFCCFVLLCLFAALRLAGFGIVVFWCLLVFCVLLWLLIWWFPAYFGVVCLFVGFDSCGGWFFVGGIIP